MSDAASATADAAKAAVEATTSAWGFVSNWLKPPQRQERYANQGRDDVCNV